MLIFIILLLFPNVTYLHPVYKSTNAGSVLFYKRSARQCWNQDDLAKLRARMIFEDIMPAPAPPDKINSAYIKNTIKYFRRALRLIDDKNDPHNAMLLKEALADTIGGHMRKDILPNARFAFYAGFVPHQNVQSLHNFYDSLKEYLNTEGNGWMPPKNVPIQSNLTVAKIVVGVGKHMDPCSSLVVKRYSNNCIHIPTPQVDEERRPSALALPFNHGGFVSLSAPASDAILLKYYTTAARCILHRSPKECRHGDFVSFNNELWHWIKRFVAPHLMDEQLYTGYGGVLRVAAAVQSYGKGLSRRNLFENEHNISRKASRFWISRTKDDLTVGDDLSPMFGIFVIMGAALGVCCLHFFYNMVCGPASNCHCDFTRRRSDRDTELAYAKVDSSFPAMLPQHRPAARSIDVNKRVSRTKSASNATTRTQKVFDLNEDKERLMSVVMSDKDYSEDEYSTSEEETTVNRTEVSSIRAMLPRPQRTPRSPPKIEAPIQQMRIEKTPQGGSAMESSNALYSKSHVTRSEAVTYLEQISESTWSGSSSTERSMSSMSGRGGGVGHGPGHVTPTASSRSRTVSRCRLMSRLSIPSTSVDHSSDQTIPIRRSK